MGMEDKKQNQLTYADLKRLGSKNLSHFKKKRLPTKPAKDYKLDKPIQLNVPFRKTQWQPVDASPLYTECNNFMTFPYGVPYDGYVRKAEEILAEKELPRNVGSGNDLK